MDGRANRDVTQRQRITSPDWCLRATDQSSTCGDTLRCNDVATLTINIQQQRDIGATVWIVFQTLNRARNTILAALEIDQTVMLLVTTAHMTGSDMTVIVTTGRFGLLFQQSRNWLTFMQLLVDHAQYCTLSRCRWF